MHQICLAAAALALHNDEEDLDVSIGAPYLNRDSEDDQDVVGLFLQPLPIRITYKNGPAYEKKRTFLGEVQRTSQAALSHAIQFEALLSLLSIKPEYPNHPLFDVMLTFHELGEGPKLRIPNVKSIHTWTRGAKFKIMAEFTVTEEHELLLRLEYSTECFDEQDVKVIGMRIVKALEGICSGLTYDEVRKHVVIF